MTARETDFEPNRQDNDIFQLSRNINVGFFATVVLKDYVAAILNTPRADSEWWLNLGAEIKSGGQRLERGTGSVVSTEFAVLYHWHAALSAADDQWMEEIIRQAIPELKDIDDMTPEMMTRTARRLWISSRASSRRLKATLYDASAVSTWARGVIPCSRSAARRSRLARDSSASTRACLTTLACS